MANLHDEARPWRDRVAIFIERVEAKSFSSRSTYRVVAVYPRCLVVASCRNPEMIRNFDAWSVDGASAWRNTRGCRVVHEILWESVAEAKLIPCGATLKRNWMTEDMFKLVDEKLKLKKPQVASRLGTPVALVLRLSDGSEITIDKLGRASRGVHLALISHLDPESTEGVELPSPAPPTVATVQPATGLDPERSAIKGALFRFLSVVLVICTIVSPFLSGLVFSFLGKPIHRELSLAYIAQHYGFALYFALVTFPFGLAAAALDAKGRRLRMTSAAQLLAKDQGRTILYLRRFTDEDTVYLADSSDWRAAMFNSGSMFGVLGPVFGAILAKVCPIRFEEVIMRYFGRYGPCIAIGKPGDKYPPLGCARIYATESDWQSVVLRHLPKCGLVILQPSDSDGVHWEVTQILEHVEPTKLLLMIPQYVDDADGYERMVDRLGSSFPKGLPSTQPVFEFLAFEPDWTPYPIRVFRRKGMRGGAMGSPIRMKRTFGPMMKRAGFTPKGESPVAYLRATLFWLSLALLFILIFEGRVAEDIESKTQTQRDESQMLKGLSLSP